MARAFDRQVAELQIRAPVLNRYTALGTPVTEPVGQVPLRKGGARGTHALRNRASAWRKVLAPAGSQHGCIGGRLVPLACAFGRLPGRAAPSRFQMTRLRIEDDSCSNPMTATSTTRMIAAASS